MNLYPKLAAASLDWPEDFAEKSLQILQRHLKLKAASFYSYSTRGEALTLRGQVGLDYRLYKAFELPLDTPAGEAARKRTIVWCEDVQKDSRYRDRTLISRFNLRELLVIPLEDYTDPEANERRLLGVICAYPEPNTQRDSLANALQEVAPFIARLYRAAFERLQLIWRSKLVERVSKSHDIVGVTGKGANLLGELLHVEAVTVFVHDDRNGFLRMRATTAQLTGEPKGFFLLPRTKDVTYSAFLEGLIKVFNRGEFSFDRTSIHELLSDSPRHCLIIPFVLGVNSGHGKARLLGVMRIFNHQLTLGGVTHDTAFGWEEIFLVKFFAEMLAVMMHFMKKGANAEDDFTRSMHGAKNNLQAAINHLRNR